MNDEELNNTSTESVLNQNLEDELFSMFFDESEDLSDGSINDDLGSSFNDLDTLFDLTYDEDTTSDYVKFSGYYIDYLGINPNMILCMDSETIIKLLKLYYNRKKLTFLKQNIEGFTTNQTRYEGFIDYLMRNLENLPEEYRSQHSSALEVVATFKRKWAEISKFIDSLTNNSTSFTISKVVEDLLQQGKHNNDQNILISLRTGDTADNLFINLISNPNKELTDYIINKIKTAELVTESIKEYGNDDEIQTFIDEVLSYEYSYPQSKGLLTALGFISSIYGKERHIIKDIGNRSTGEKDNLKYIRPKNVIARLINLKLLSETNVNSERKFIEF